MSQISVSNLMHRAHTCLDCHTYQTCRSCGHESPMPHATYGSRLDVCGVYAIQGGVRFIARTHHRLNSHLTRSKNTFRALYSNREADYMRQKAWAGFDRFQCGARPRQDCPRGRELHSFYKFHMQQSQHRVGDKLKTGKGSQAHTKTKAQNDGCLWSQGLHLSLPVICWV